MYLPKIVLAYLCLRVLFSTAITYVNTTKVECIMVPKFIYNHTCYLKQVNRLKKLIYMEMYSERMFRNVTVNVRLLSHQGGNNYKPFLIDYTGNVCRFVKIKPNGHFLSNYVRLLKKFSNINHSCPFEGYFVLNGLDLNADSRAYFLIPTKRYKLVLRSYEGYPLELFGTYEIYLDVVRN